MKTKHSEEDVFRAVEQGEIEIDSMGRVWRVAARRWNRWAKKTIAVACVRRRAEKKMPTGYMMVRAMFGLKRHCCLAHRLVWFAANGAIPGDMTINHRNGVKTDNRLENLELATAQEQMAHSIRVLGRKFRRHPKTGKFLGLECTP